MLTSELKFQLLIFEKIFSLKEVIFVLLLGEEDIIRCEDLYGRELKLLLKFSTFPLIFISYGLI